MLEAMTKKELLEVAAAKGIQGIPSKATKADIIEKIKNVEEDKGMELFDKEVLENEETKVEDTDTSETEVETEEGVTYVLDDGTEGTRSAYIRQEFKKNRSRNDIAKELDVKYYVVYSATANMYNEVHKEGASLASGRTSTLVAKVNSKFQFIGDDGEVTENEDDAVVVPRADLLRELYNQGVSRKKLAEYFGIQYATVYAATKGDDVKPREKQVVIDPETGTEVPRADYIRKCFNGGMERKDIAQHVTEITGKFCDYATVWAATKAKTEDAEEVVEETTPADAE